MEMQKERVLAYTLARVLDEKELSEVSGGGAGGVGLMSHNTTLRPSGATGSMDAFVDFHLDW